MKRMAKVGSALAAGVILALSGTTTASAAEALMGNDPQYPEWGDCSGNVIMNYFYTVRTDVVWASYYDEYFSSSQGRWIAASSGKRLHDSWAAGQTMITNLRANTGVSVMADQLVSTRQGNTCYQMH